MLLGFPPPTASELRALLALALPVITVQVGLMAMGVADTIMVGHVSAAALAAVALGNLYFFGAAIFGMGTLMALDPVVAQAVGAGDQAGVARGIQRGLVLAGLLVIPAALLLAPAPAVLAWLRQPDEVIPQAAAYARISIPGTLGFYAFVVLRQSLQAMGRVRPILITVVVANLVNVALNWMLIYGRLGFPALGARGAAWATVISRLVLALLLLRLGWPLLAPHLRPLRREALEPGPLRRLFVLGAPIGVQHQLEYGVFGLVGVLMGVLGADQMAGHQIALNLASVTFMVPLGLSAAAAVLVGHAVGREDPEGARRSASAAMACAVGFMGATAIAFVALPRTLAGLYTNVTPALLVAATLIPIAGVFQVFDGIQVTSIGVLRGLGDTRTPMVVNLLGFWFIGLPVSLWLGFGAGLGPQGLWWGLVIGLVLVAAVLLLRVRARLRGPLRRLHLEHAAPEPPPDRTDPCCVSTP
jgi:MATE family multidrug resistance protein